MIATRVKGRGAIDLSTGSYNVSRWSCWGVSGGGDITRVEKVERVKRGRAWHGPSPTLSKLGRKYHHE
jgi:hypothetical protein